MSKQDWIDIIVLGGLFIAFITHPVATITGLAIFMLLLA
jgi:hypothetical protein